MNVLRVGEVDSTQRLARELAAEGAPHGTAVVAESQSAGRGRLGRRWEGAPGESLLVSWVLRPQGLLAEAPLLSLGAAAGLATAFDLRVKWPNDLVSPAGQKVGGLLAEADANGATIHWIVLGLGLNVHQRSFPPELPDATSLALLGAEPPALAEVLDVATRAVLAWCSHPARLDQWRERSHTLGRRVRVGDREGVATGLRSDGALLIDGAPVLAGDVEMVRTLRGAPE